MAVFTPTITGLTSLTTENVNIDNNSITALNSSIEQVSYTSLSENFIKRSEEISNSAVWGILNSTSVSADNVTDPNGTTTADSLSIATANNSGVNQTGVSSVTTGNHTFSLYVKRIGSVDQTARLLLGDGISSSLAGFTATSSWQRVSVTKNMASTNITVQIRNADAGGVKTIAVWGAQVNSGSSAGVYFPTTIGERLAITGVTRGVSGSTAATANSGAAVTIGSVSTTLTENISATQDYIPLTSLTGMAASGSAVIGTSNMDLNLSSSGTGSVTINEIKTNSVTGEVIPGKLGGTNFIDSLLIGHSTTGTLNTASLNTGVGIGAMTKLTSGDQNTTLGHNAGGNITSGSGNTFIGMMAGQSVAGGTNNTAVGKLAGGGLNSAANFNTMIGEDAGLNITSGDGNVVIGNADVASATGDRQLVIAGFDGTTTTTWISGDSSGNLTFPAQTTTDSLVAGSISVDNLILNSNAISAVNSSVEQINYSTLSSNEILYSQDATQLSSSANVTVANAAGTAPDGTNTAVSMTPTGTGTSSYVKHLPQISPLVAGVSVPLTYSVYLKGTGFIQLYTNTFHIGNGVVNVDLSDGSLTASGDNTMVVKSFDVGNGWYRVEIGKAITPANPYYQGTYAIASVDSASASRAAVSSNTNVKYWWGAQFEKTWQNGSTISSSTGVTNAGPYVPTDGTRIALALAGVNRTASVADSVIRGASGTTASSANADVVVNIGSTTTALLTSITTTSKVIPIDEVSGLPTSGTAVIGTSNVDLNLSASGTGNVKLANDEKLVFGDAGEHIVGNGTNLTISSSGTTTLDSVGNIILDADTTGVTIADNGQGLLKMFQFGGFVALESMVSDKDLILRGNDGGSYFNALTLDMSEAGNATFNGNIEAANFKQEGTNFTRSLLIGHSNHGTLNAATDNTGVGINALNSLTSGDQNTALGAYSGQPITTGVHNTSVGYISNRSTTTGNSNTAVGRSALHSNISGDNNTAVGAISLTACTGEQNTAVGYASQQATIGGDKNTSLGWNSIGGNTTANYNIGIGHSAGVNLTTGSGNVIIGSINADAVDSTRTLKIAGNDGTNTTTWISGDSSGNLTTVGDVTLANYGKLLSNAGLEINVPGSNEDFRITGNDAGTAITPLLMDMSAGGNLTLTGGSGNVQTWARRDTSASLTLAFPSAKATFSSSHSLIYNCAGSEKMRLENDGTLLLGTTDDGEAGAGDMVVAGGIFLGGNAAANELDDYEEGTFTPAILPNGGSVTNATQTGHYTKIGRIVYFDIRVGISAISSPTGTLKVAGLPFNGGIGGRAGLVSIATINNCGSLTLANTLGSYISTGDAVHIVSNDGSNNNAPQLTATTQFDISGMYQTT